MNGYGRKAHAEKLFRGISLDPQKSVLLSDSLKKAGATVELRGRDYAKLKTLHESEDWLGLMNAAKGKNPWGAYPSINEIDELFLNEFCENDRFSLLLKVKDEESLFEFRRNKTYRCATLPFNTDHIIYRLYRHKGRLSFEADANGFSRHPDGIGYLTTWKPGMGECVIYIANYDDEDGLLSRMNSDLSGFLKTMEEKVKLGEMEEESLRSRHAEEVIRVCREFKLWALSQ